MPISMDAWLVSSRPQEEHLPALPTVGDCRFHRLFEHLQDVVVLSTGAVATLDEFSIGDPAEVDVAQDVQAPAFRL